MRLEDFKKTVTNLYSEESSSHRSYLNKFFAKDNKYLPKVAEQIKDQEKLEFFAWTYYTPFGRAKGLKGLLDGQSYICLTNKRIIIMLESFVDLEVRFFKYSDVVSLKLNYDIDGDIVFRDNIRCHIRIVDGNSPMAKPVEKAFGIIEEHMLD